MMRLPRLRKLELALIFILLTTAAGLWWNHAQKTMHPESERLSLQPDTSHIAMTVWVRECPTDLAALVDVGDPYLFKGEELARIVTVTKSPSPLLVYSPEGLQARTSTSVIDLTLTVSLSSWLDKVGQFQLGQIIEFNTPEYALEAMIIELPLEPAPQPPTSRPWLLTLYIKTLPTPFHSGLQPGAFGLDDTGRTELLLVTAEADPDAGGFSGTIAREATSPDKLTAPAAFRFRGHSYADFRLVVKAWPVVKDGEPYYHGALLKRGRVYTWQFTRLAVEGMLIDLHPEAASSN